mgnify:CR=1 FL=1|tara:strand:- start:372 stop:635 length:264 start_codon:yes stop_codon:yes gene_type:complete
MAFKMRGFSPFAQTEEKKEKVVLGSEENTSTTDPVVYPADISDISDAVLAKLPLSLFSGGKRDIMTLNNQKYMAFKKDKSKAKSFTE